METENIVTLFKFAIKENRETGAVTIVYRLGRVFKMGNIRARLYAQERFGRGKIFNAERM